MLLLLCFQIQFLVTKINCNLKCKKKIERKKTNYYKLFISDLN